MRKFTIGFLALLTVAMLGATRTFAAAEIGKPAPGFELQGSDGQTHKLSDYKGKIVVVYFHAVNCPWAKAYQPILNDDAAKFASGGSKGVVFLGINSNRGEGENMAAIKTMISGYHINHVILKDPGNKIADAYGAVCTPHVFIIDADGKLRYEGGIEKAPVSPSDVGQSKDQYLVPALEALATGKDPSPTESKPIGCGIKRVR